MPEKDVLSVRNGREGTLSGSSFGRILVISAQSQGCVRCKHSSPVISAVQLGESIQHSTCNVGNFKKFQPPTCCY